MAHFTKQEIEEIRSRLISRSVKDSQLPEANIVQLEDFVAIVQGGVNKKVTVDNLYSDICGQLYEKYILAITPVVKNGSTVLRPGRSADLRAEVILGETDVTDKIAPNFFSWERSSNNPEGDQFWNEQHEGVGPEIHIDYSEILGGCTIYCLVPIDCLKTLIV